MDKYEYKVRADEIRELIARREFVQAAEIADTIDWRRVKSVKMLCTISDVYKINRRFEDAKDLLLLAYEHRPGGRNICFSLCELSIKTGEIVQAMEYYKEFVQVAPQDSGRYILQYRLYEDQEVSIEERIEVLEELKKRDYREKWAYELAYLYHRAGLATRCVEECDELILWFGDGKYVIKAMELKMLHQPLTEEQQETYDHRFDTCSWEVESEQVVYGSANGQYEEAYLFGEKEAGEDPNEAADSMGGTTRVYDPAQIENRLRTEGQTGTGTDAQAMQPDEMDIQVKTMDVGEYNTINLQATLAQEMRELFKAEQENTAAVSEDIRQNAPAEEAMAAEETAGENPETYENAEVTETYAAEGPTEAEKALLASRNTGEIVLEQMRLEAGQSYLPEKEPIEEPPEELARVLSQESDGQIRLVMPEKEPVEKQITGQMKIEDVLAEWERMKKENEEKRKEDVRKHVLRQTGEMFTEFEAAMRDGLLEKLEKSAGEPEEVYNSVMPGTNMGEPEIAESIKPETAGEEISGQKADEEEPVRAETMDAEASEQETAAEEPAKAEAAEEETARREVAAEQNVAETATNAEEKAAAEQAGDAEDQAESKDNVRAMTREEKDLYANYIQSKSTKEQIVKAIDTISMAAYTGNVIITGQEGMDTLPLAKSMIKEIQTTDSNFAGKVAKISGKGLNRKNVDEVLEHLKSGALIVTDACAMDDKTVQSLYKGLQRESLGIIVILLDVTKTMNRFLKDRQLLLELFNARVDVEALSNDMLVMYGKQFAREQEFAIDELGVLALHNRIEQRQTIDHAVTTAEVEEIVRDAIRRANRKTIKHFFDILLAKRYDEEDMIVVTERDFV